MRFLGLCLILLLGGCNRVYSHQPLFGDAEAAGLPAIRPGHWLLLDPDRTAASPETRILMRPGGRAVFVDENGTRIRLRLFPGDPLIIQTWVPPSQGGPGYFYYGSRLRKFDAQGRATAISLWPVDCGPPPPEPVAGAARQWVTAAPYPGVLIDGDNCLAWTSAAVRNAARASEGQEKAADLVWTP